jgi:hypothetical protein
MSYETYIRCDARVEDAVFGSMQCSAVYIARDTLPSRARAAAATRDWYIPPLQIPSSPTQEPPQGPDYCPSHAPPAPAPRRQPSKGTH